LFAFFLTSIALTSAGRSRKRLLVDIPKGGPRDALQVFANGGIATLCAIVAGCITHGGIPSETAYALFWAYAGAYAAATADTWSTEIGSAFGGTPRSLVGFQPVAPGISGGVTVLGSAAMLAGAAWIALVSGEFFIVTAAGVAGALVDSLLGATLQSMRYCPQCTRPTETATHACGSATTPLRGLTWMTNDAVNTVATLTGAVVAAVLFLLR